MKPSAPLTEFPLRNVLPYCLVSHFPLSLPEPSREQLLNSQAAWRKETSLNNSKVIRSLCWVEAETGPSVLSAHT